jgi:hypothetical protein
MTSFSSLIGFALRNLVGGFKEHAPYYIVITAIGVALALLSPGTLRVVPLHVFFSYFALAFAVRRFDPGFRMTPADVAGVVVIGFVIVMALALPVFLLPIRGAWLLLLPMTWIIVKWSLAAPLYVMPSRLRRSPIDALRDSWNIVTGERWWLLFIGSAVVSSVFLIAAQMLARSIYAPVQPGSSSYAATGLATASIYAGWILTNLWLQLVNTAAAFAWTSRTP